MDRLLLIFLRRFIRRGSFKVTTAGGSTYTLGDGSGPPVAVRFTTAAAERAVLFDPELKLGESLYGRQARRRARLDRRCAGGSAAPGAQRDVELGLAAATCPLSVPPACSNTICGRGRARTSPIITTSTAGSIRCFSTATSNIAAPISTRPTSRSTTPNWPKSAIWRPSCGCRPAPRCSTSAAAGAGLRSISPKLPAPKSPALRCRKSSSRSHRTARSSAA